LSSPDCHGRYGFVYDRFKPRAWGAEFRILGRKTMLLFATTLLAEHTYPCIAAQIAIIGWLIFKQCQECPYAEVGSATKAFIKKYPDGNTGWSRGDKLEVLTLLGQLGNVVVTLVCSVVELKDAGTVAVSAAVLTCVLCPASYAVRIVWTEWLHKWILKSKRKKITPEQLLRTERGDEFSNPVAPDLFCECGARSSRDGGEFCSECGAPSRDFVAGRGSSGESMEVEI
jgi:hypothetical protein